MTRYDITGRQIDIFVNGDLDLEKLHHLFETIASDARFHCGLKQFWHFQEVDCSNLRSSGLPALGLSLENTGQSYPQVALIAKTDLLFGLCRVYAAWVDGKPVEIGVFRDYEDALSWAYPEAMSEAELFGSC